MIREAKRILETVENLSIHHNYHEANLVVNRLVNDVVDTLDLRVWESK